MANRTDPSAKSIRGTDPQNLIDKILRNKIHQSTYWKDQCLGLTAETLVNRAIELDHIGGTFGGNRKPTPFICLVNKMLQIQPGKEIVIEFIENKTYNSKYVRALGAFYLRLTFSDVDVYRWLEPLYYDYGKMKVKSADGSFKVTNMDVFVDELLTKDCSCDVVLPYIKKRSVLESFGLLEPRRSIFEDEVEYEDFEDEVEDEDMPRKKREKKDDGTGHQDPEIAEANRLRASVGLKPLRL